MGRKLNRTFKFKIGDVIEHEPAVNMVRWYNYPSWYCTGRVEKIGYYYYHLRELTTGKIRRYEISEVESTYKLIPGETAKAQFKDELGGLIDD